MEGLRQILRDLLRSREVFGLLSRKEAQERANIERVLEANAASVAFAGTVLAATVHKRWLMLPVLVTGFLFQHALQGWCPRVPVLRWLGYRTSREIETERVALKALRGDFGKIAPPDAERQRSQPCASGCAIVANPSSSR